MDRELSTPPRIPVRSCLVLGGARSGKSAYAQRLAEQSDRALVYLATATAWDDEMRARIALHQGQREGRWTTVEEPLHLREALLDASSSAALVVVDCLTLWLTNVMLGGRDAAAETERLAEGISSLPAPVIFVTNEVGAGIVPDNALARDFRDAQGRLNQVMARVCDAAVLVTAGLPTILKPSAQPTLALETERLRS